MFESLGTYLAPAHLLARSLLPRLTTPLTSLLRLALSSLAHFLRLMLRAFSRLAFLVFSSLTLLALANLPPPLHLFRELCGEGVFRVAWRLGKFVVVALPEI